MGFLFKHCFNADVSCFWYCYRQYWVYHRAQVEIWTKRHGTNRIGRWVYSKCSGRGQSIPWMCQIHTVWLINRLINLNKQLEHESCNSWASQPLRFSHKEFVLQKLKKWQHMVRTPQFMLFWLRETLKMTEAVLRPGTIPTTALMPAPLTEISWRIRDRLVLSRVFSNHRKIQSTGSKHMCA